MLAGVVAGAVIRVSLGSLFIWPDRGGSALLVMAGALGGAYLMGIPLHKSPSPGVNLG
jgi:hypothetical protein